MTLSVPTGFLKSLTKGHIDKKCQKKNIFDFFEGYLGPILSRDSKIFEKSFIIKRQGEGEVLQEH